MRESAVAIGGVAVAAICCLAAPAAAALIGGVTIAVVLGWVALLAAGIAASLFVIPRVMRAIARRDR